MTQVRRILYASDLSRASRQAFATAVTLAKAHRASLTVLHVVEPVTPTLPDEYIGSATWDQIDRDTRAWASRQLDALVQKARAQGVRATMLMVDGSAADRIARAARFTKADLLVVGTHGRSGLTKFLVGSVAQRVVALAPCPVVTVKGG